MKTRLLQTCSSDPKISNGASCYGRRTSYDALQKKDACPLLGLNNISLPKDRASDWPKAIRGKTGHQLGHSEVIPQAQEFVHLQRDAEESSMERL